MEPEVQSLKQPSTGPYPKPNSPHTPNDITSPYRVFYCPAIYFRISQVDSSI